MRQETKIVKQFDKNSDGWLNLAERKAAREFLAGQNTRRDSGGPGGRRRGFGPPGREQAPPQPGPKVSPADVASFPGAPLYASNVVRTVFLEFEEPDWEKALQDFKFYTRNWKENWIGRRIFERIPFRTRLMEQFMVKGSDKVRSFFMQSGRLAIPGVDSYPTIKVQGRI